MRDGGEVPPAWGSGGKVSEEEGLCVLLPQLTW